MLSKRQRSTEVAISEKIAKLTPLPSQVAPSGYGYPNQIFTGVMKTSVSYPLRFWSWQRTKNFLRKSLLSGERGRSFSGERTRLACWFRRLAETSFSFG